MDQAKGGQTRLMGRDRTGSIWTDSSGATYGRITWKDASGKRRERKRKSISGTKREARRHIKEMLDDLAEQGDGRAIDASALTFKQLFDYYEREYAVAAEYDLHGIKKNGLRSHRDVIRKLNTLRVHFRGRVREASYGDIATFKRLRLNTPVAVRHRVSKRKSRHPEYRTDYHPRSIASVNRELSTLRRVFTVAVQHRWLTRNPFSEGEPLINIAEEQPRERIATKDERDRLLAVCVGGREHLRPFLVLAFDTGFRGGEMLRLRVGDVNFDDNCITAVSYKGKQRRERLFDMTARLRAEMLTLCEGRNPADPVFGFKSVKRSFATAKRLAGLGDANFRLHDARHTATTRLLEKGMTLSEAGKLMGHTQPSTTWRYMHAGKHTRQRAAELLEEDTGTAR
jgi:integrase